MEESFISRSLILVAVFGVVVGLTLLVTGPFREVAAALGLPVSLHAGAATALLLVGTAALPLARQLLLGTLDGVQTLRLLATLEAALAVLTPAFGSWLFLRSSYSGILQSARPAHQILFEFKTVVALFPVPLASGAAWLLWRHGGRVLTDQRLRTWVALLVGLSFFYLVMAFGIGAAVTRLRSL